MLYHLRVQARGQPEFWLDIEARGESQLTDLDDYLRAIWLECCGHLSRFSVGGWSGDECGADAAWLCEECLIEDQIWGVLCDEHAKEHPHDNYGEPIRLVNSPRLGMCGYTGPAEPPY
mgnify:CR=1 FL=1